jgi:sirohydrochlorin ferrochelatase
MNDAQINQTEREREREQNDERLMDVCETYLLEIGVDEALAQQHAISHVLNKRLRATAVVKVYLAADFLSKLAAELLSNSCETTPPSKKEQQNLIVSFTRINIKIQCNVVK